MNAGVLIKPSSSYPYQEFIKLGKLSRGKNEKKPRQARLAGPQPAL